MPKMTYQDHIGKDYRFKKGQQIPQWLFENVNCHFGCNSLIIPLENKVYWFGKPDDGRSFVEIKSGMFDGATQICPIISWYTTEQDIYVFNKID